jgi:SpoVK/Ycf46/Vps4 family AAA+-type ATPase
LEFEKFFSGVDGKSMDSGVSDRMYALWLLFTQECQKDVFIVALCNSVANLPAPAIRKGRFDEIFYVGLPGPNARREIFKIHLDKRGWGSSKFDLAELAQKTPGRTGAEIEQIVNEALIIKINELGLGRDKAVTMDHLNRACKKVVPMIKTNKAEVEAIRNWCSERNVMNASTEEEDLNEAMATIQGAYKMGERDLGSDLMSELDNEGDEKL